MLENFRTQKIIWDRANRKIFETIEANSGDSNGRKLVVQVINQETTESLSGTTLSLGWKSRSGTKGLDAFNVVDASKGIFEIYYTTEMLSNIGNIEASLILINSTGRIESSAFTISVRPSTVDDESVESENSFTALTEALVKVNDFDAQLAQKVTYTELDAQLATLLDGGPSIFMDTLALLQSTYPNGASGVALVRETDPAKIYVWDGTAWVDYGPYQGIEVKDGTITLPKISLDGYLPKPIEFTRTGNTRVTSAPTFLNEGDILETKGGVKISVLDSGLAAMHPGFIDEFNVPISQEYTIRAGFANDDLVEGRVKEFSEKIHHITTDTSAKRADLLKLPTVSSPLLFVKGAITTSGEPTTGATRVRVNDWVSISEGDYLSVEDGYEFALVINGNNNYEGGGWRTDTYTAQYDQLIMFMVRKSDNSAIDVNVVSEKTTLKVSKNLVTLGDVNDIVRDQDNTGAKKIKYVSLLGSDSNNGSSLASGYATLQKAVNEGATTVYMERGDYYNQTFLAPDMDELTILPANHISYMTGSQEPVKKIRFIGADKLSSLTQEGSLLTQSYAGGYQFRQVFIDKTLAPETTSSRPSYNCTIWEVNGTTDDYKLKPVLTKAECEAEEGTFYWDGNKVYIHASDVNNDFFATKQAIGLRFQSVKQLKMHDVAVDFTHGTPIDLDRLMTLDIQNCEANYSTTTDGFSIDYSNGEFTDCLARKNRNDGFNLHFFGDTKFINCYGIDNYDDGISHHEGCTGVIIGGLWKGNGKGGVAPAHGAKVNVYNATLEDNNTGFYNQHAWEVGNVSSGNLYRGNQYAIRSDNTVLTSINDKFVDNTSDFIGNGSVDIV